MGIGPSIPQIPGSQQQPFNPGQWTPPPGVGPTIDVPAQTVPGSVRSRPLYRPPSGPGAAAAAALIYSVGSWGLQQLFKQEPPAVSNIPVNILGSQSLAPGTYTYELYLAHWDNSYQEFDEDTAWTSGGPLAGVYAFPLTNVFGAVSYRLEIWFRNPDGSVVSSPFWIGTGGGLQGQDDELIAATVTVTQLTQTGPEPEKAGPPQPPRIESPPRPEPKPPRIGAPPLDWKFEEPTPPEALPLIGYPPVETDAVPPPINVGQPDQTPVPQPPGKGSPDGAPTPSPTPQPEPKRAPPIPLVIERQEVYPPTNTRDKPSTDTRTDVQTVTPPELTDIIKTEINAPLPPILFRPDQPLTPKPPTPNPLNPPIPVQQPIPNSCKPFQDFDYCRGFGGRDGNDGQDGDDVNKAQLDRIEAKVDGVSSQVTGVQATTGAHAASWGTWTAAKWDVFSTKFNEFNDFVKKAYTFTRLDKVINALTLVMAIHNGALLARNLGESASWATGRALNLFGIKDEEGNDINVGSILGQNVTDLIKSVIGEEAYNDTSLAWQKMSRIVTSASNIVWTIRSITDSSQEVMEWIGENTGKIGNALKQARVVGENAYQWLPERLPPQGKWRRMAQKFIDGTAQLDDAFSSVGAVVDEGLSIRDEIDDLKKQKDDFKEDIANAVKGTPVENIVVKTEREEQITDSRGATPTPLDEEKGDEPEA